MVEVADAAEGFDRGRKGAPYARAEVPEYWVLNVADGCLEVYRQPEGGNYRVARVLRPPEAERPLACPERLIPVGDLLP